ncbi:hypothetical protein Golob_006043, partial [Gossypium lobatum]|nr:hypothetical protein [Gossypium lobatum]
INSWSKRLLSYRAREIFIKSILQSLPTYALSVFLAPKGYIKEMQAKMRRICWACKDKGCGWAMLPWEKVYLPTGMEGIGFRHIRLFNIPLLGRQAILTIGDLDGRIINNDYSNCIDCREEAMRGKEEAAWVIWERPKSLSKEFRIHNMINRPILLPHIVDKKWEKLPTDKAEWDELCAFEESIRVVRSLNIAKAIFETDCASLANKIKNRRVDITIMGQRINNLFKSKDMINNAKLKWVNHNCNKAMNFMSYYAITNNCNLNFGLDYPMAIHDFL